jgi:hypothetical protein
MSLRVVTPAGGAASITVAWDNSQLTVPSGVIVDIPPGSSMETAYGTTNLTALTGQALNNILTGSNPVVTDNA